MPFFTAVPAQALRPFRQLDRPLEVIRQFTPNWFAVTMGTGVLALALAAFPWQLPGLHALAEGLWLLAVLLFGLFTGLYAARWLLFFDEAREIFAHATVSMSIGTIPMGLATLINGLLLFGLPRWGAAVLPLALGLWWLDVAMALACGVLIPYLMFTRQAHRIDQMTAVWLLPVVAAEVAAASGGLLLPHLAAGEHFTVLVASYVLWAYSVPVALSLLVILLLRLALHRLPPASMAASSWLALGPIATGALGLLVLGSAAPAVFAAHGLAGIGEIARGLGLLGALLLWGLGLWWLALAVLVTQRQAREGMPFNLGWWGFTFPLGVYALTTLRLGEALAAPFFTGLGAALVVLLALLWLLVASRTLAGAYRGGLFVSPCIAHLCRKVR
ncbi:C4-dicarboxylate ABC transporter [Pseudomonas oryzihabitans]|uniref:C4-dicarboxylate transporter/malic acid transport protein n=1 Tax=Pseudomonas oryzihabitans TaxID=47885 RepID=A0A1G5PE25_9PSED|nr:C4-dicarboxylate ABC transporter [Pseudomonas psychrotolerans]NMY91651.1 C4-dicarboxylate ABC transporter [Pseudomonas psychrotolerans]SCZ47792.1 C4-dicarboxylate transporter/malic acid transport protein [Pseudomonas psychrotolerans]